MGNAIIELCLLLSQRERKSQLEYRWANLPRRASPAEKKKKEKATSTLATDCNVADTVSRSKWMEGRKQSKDS